jgi:hypothetical protein
MSKETNKLFGGIKVRNDNEISRNLFCELCKLLLLNPTQLLCCGTRLCRWCSKKGLSNRWLFLIGFRYCQFLKVMFVYSKPFICPFCHTEQPKRQVKYFTIYLCLYCALLNRNMPIGLLNENWTRLTFNVIRVLGMDLTEIIKYVIGLSNIEMIYEDCFTFRNT